MGDNYWCNYSCLHDDVIQWKHFPRYWPFVRGIHRSHNKGQWRGALVFSVISAWINSWINNREAGDLRRHCAHYDVSVSTLVCAGSEFVLHIPLQHDTSYRIAMIDEQRRSDFLDKWMSNRVQHITSLSEPRFCCWAKRPTVDFIHL